MTTESEQNQNDLYEQQAKELVGKWLYNKTLPSTYLFVYDYYRDVFDGAVSLNCLAFHPTNFSFHPTIEDWDDDTVLMSRYKDNYRELQEEKGLARWAEIKDYYDSLLGVSRSPKTALNLITR